MNLDGPIGGMGPETKQCETRFHAGVGSTVSRAVLVRRERTHKDRSGQHGQHAGVLHAAAGSRDGGAGVHDGGRRPPRGVRTALRVPLTLERHAARTRGRRAGAGSTRRSCTCSASRPGRSCTCSASWTYGRMTRSCEQSQESTGAYSHAGYTAYTTQTHSASTWVGAAGASDNRRESIRKVLCFWPAKCTMHVQPVQPLQTSVHMGCTRACEGDAEAVRHKAHLISKLKAGKNHEHAQIFSAPVCICSISRTQ
jgi:hypothetical protein